MLGAVGRYLLYCGLVIGGLASAWAQTAPDAGTLRQQIDNTLKVPLPLALPEGMALTVKAFRFEGNTLIDEAQLQAVVQGWRDRPIGFGDLQRAAQAVAAAYRAAGWIVQTHLPRQDVTEGVVTIRIVLVGEPAEQVPGQVRVEVTGDAMAVGFQFTLPPALASRIASGDTWVVAQETVILCPHG